MGSRHRSYQLGRSASCRLLRLRAASLRSRTLTKGIAAEERVLPELQRLLVSERHDPRLFTTACTITITGEHATVRILRYTPNRGKGHAVRVGMAEAHGGAVAPARHREYGPADLIVGRDAEVFAGLPTTSRVWMSHGDRVERLPDGFHSIGHTDNSPAAAIANGNGSVGLQFHPEVAHTPFGTMVIKNFVRNVCGCGGTWTSGAFVDETVAAIRAQVGKERVLCALSGGVDSAVACALAVRRGMHAVGLTMRLWSPGSAELSEKVRQCCGPTAYRDARAAAAITGIPHYIVNFEAAFQQAVVSYFCREYLAGRTPNPCVACNNLIKFGVLLDLADAFGRTYDRGRYNRVVRYSISPPHWLSPIDRDWAAKLAHDHRG